jgi:protein-L-isoaspartate(D-aspartate) O-methyltransferase
MTGSAPKRFPLGLDDLVRVPPAKGGRAGAQGQAGEKVNVGAKTATKATVAHAGFNSKPAKTLSSAKPAAKSTATPPAKPAAKPATGTDAAARSAVTGQISRLAGTKVPSESRERAAVLATEQAKPHERGQAERVMPGFVVRSPMRAEPPVKIVRSVASSVKQAVGVGTPLRPTGSMNSPAPSPVTAFAGTSAAQKGLASKTAVPYSTGSRNPSSLAASTSFTLTSERVRERMVERVRASGVSDPRVLAAMAAVPRHLFVDPGFATQAYEEAALPIGHHQTISKPSVVARMIELAAAGRELDSVLEIGTGCGYQAAVLAGIARDVYSIERIRPLHERAKQNLRPLRIRNIRLHYGDGRLGIPNVAPFDAIVIAAAGLDVPQALLEQLQIGGRLIAPVGGESQVLTLVERVAANEWHESQLDRVFFVPLKSGVI